MHEVTGSSPVTPTIISVNKDAGFLQVRVFHFAPFHSPKYPYFPTLVFDANFDAPLLPAREYFHFSRVKNFLTHPQFFDALARNVVDYLKSDSIRCPPSLHDQQLVPVGRKP